MAQVKFSEARATFSELVRRAEAGETIEIVRRGKIAARLVAPKSDAIDISAGRV